MSEEKLIRRIDVRRARAEDLQEVLREQWLVTNGLGGYASGTIAGVVTWRYHGLLIAALPAPLGRIIMLNHLAEWLVLPNGRRVAIGGVETPRADENRMAGVCITEFRLENQLPIWRFEAENVVIEKQVLLPYAQNTVHITYRLLSTDSGVQLELQPSMQFRRHEHPVSEGCATNYLFSATGDRYEIAAGGGLPPLRLRLTALDACFTYDGGSRREIFYQKEAERGFDPRGTLWSPGYFCVSLPPQKNVTLIASTEDWNAMLALRPDEAARFYDARRRRLIRKAAAPARQSPAADLVLAADQFIINPVGRVQDAARAHAAGDEIRTVVAGYHWFTDWGRDTMISLEGLTLTTGRHVEAGWILRTFAHYLRDGLIPNLFPEGENEGLYHTADATLWFFHALDRYLEYTGDRDTLRSILPRLIDIVDRHVRGTRFGIAADPQDGLLRQGTPEYPLTWMDAKVEGWIVTPRRGKAVEINALWYNALRLLERWCAEESDSHAADLGRRAGQAMDSFNRRFWNPDGFLYDVVDGENGDDPACRPNQLLAISLRHPVLERRHWEPVLETVRDRLLTPVGLRSLAANHPDYQARYFGDLRARDAAYHQGTVWAWWIGPFIDAWLRVHPDDRAGAQKFLESFVPHLDRGCVGSISEIFDGEPPFTPRGCIAQAWSVAEVLRAWVKTS